jgi:hypothetical protein
MLQAPCEESRRSKTQMPPELVRLSVFLPIRFFAYPFFCLSVFLPIRFFAYPFFCLSRDFTDYLSQHNRRIFSKMAIPPVDPLSFDSPQP